MPLKHHFVCPLPNGIHARPASSLEEISRNFLSEIILVNERTGRPANSKSVLAIVGANIQHNDNCTLTVSGQDEQKAFALLTNFIETTLPQCDDVPAINLSADGRAQLPQVLRHTGITVFRGTPAVSGIAHGQIVQMSGFKIPSTLPLNGVTDTDAECRTLDDALKKLNQLYDRRIGAAKKKIEVELFKSHRAIARDSEFQQRLHGAISEHNRTVAGAVVEAETYFSKMLADSGSELLRARALDIQDVCFELLQQIYRADINPKKIQLPAEAILVAESLTPGQFLALDRNALKGLVLPHAGMTSHTVILARSFGIPTLICVHEIANVKLENQEAVLDADAGALLTNLNDAARRYYVMEQRRIKERQAQIAQFAKRPAVTQDGHKMEISANIVSADETSGAFKTGAESIGLFRTEMLFLERESAPDEAEQFETYRRALVAAKGNPVTIRTLDIGGDKPLDYLNLPVEQNPFLGFRGSRIYQKFESLFRAQIRALVRASAHGHLKLLLPMISTPDEARWVKKIISEEQQKCATEKIPFDKNMPVGAMIEVPTAAFAMDALCQELDFFSIGSNDLFQYFMAVDRANADVASLYNPSQPAFLRLLKQIIDASHAHEKQIGLCGEMGGDKKFLPLLTGLRLNSISVAAPVITDLKAELSRLNFKNCSDLLASALKSKTASEVEMLLEQFFSQSNAPLFEPALVILNSEAQTKEEAIKLAVDQLYILGRTDDSRAVEEAVWQREQTFSTGFGNGFAMPHCKSNAVKFNSLVVLKPRESIIWKSLDGMPVRVVILIATRDGVGANEHLKIFAKLSRHLMSEDFRAHLEKENDPETLCSFLREKLQPKSEPIEMKSIIASFLFAFGVNAFAAGTNAPIDLSRGLTLFEVGYSHLDTEWRWSYPQVIGEFLPNTVRSNVALFEKYPDYIFNWTGANRYRLIQEYHPDDFAVVREWVAKGRWFPAGNSWEENDVNIPSPESEIRQIMFGHDFFKKNFGTESSEYMIPDCFGFPASLPSVLAHCGIRGFSTQKLTWGSAAGIPFNVGEWIGPDGNSVIAALNPDPYVTKITNNPAFSEKWKQRISEDGAKSGVFADYTYYGVGDRGGAPTEESVQWIEQALNSTGAVHVISSRADEMFNDISDAQKKQLPKYQGDLLLTQHSAGSINSQAYMKKWNRDNEMLANEAETAAVAANLLGALPYPREKLHHAWELVLTCQFHDMLPGTSLPKVYEYAWNDEIIAMNCFAEVLQNSVGAVARGLDTQGNGQPLVVYNPLSISREDVAEAELEFSTLPVGVQVFDGDGKPVPTQLLSRDGNKAKFIFLAKVSPVSFSVFSAKSLETANIENSPLKITEHSLENERYKITIDDTGDISSIIDKMAGREMLSAPSRLDFQTESPSNYPAWNMDWDDQRKSPRDYVNGPAKIHIVENGPVRVAIQIEREAENSVFIQTISLASRDAGNRVEIENHINWQSKNCALKAEFPLTVSNLLATYNWNLGKIERGNNDPKKYEVPSHQWFDLTDKNGKYGVTILAPTKYGSDKPADNLLRLTLLYTPGVTNDRARNKYLEQQWQDWGRHDFVYGIYGHTGDWRDGKSDWQSARLDQPLLAFATIPHEGKLGRSFSLLNLNSDQIAVRAIKLAENGDKVIVRLQELNGEKISGVNLNAANGISDATEVNGIEKPLNPLPVSGDKLKLNFTPYQMRSLALMLAAPGKLSPPVCQSVDLSFDFNAFGARGEQNSSGGFDGNGATIPSEMIGDKVISEGITFQIAPRDGLNAIACQGQTISLPAGQFNELYLLAASANGDAEAEFSMDGNLTKLNIQNWTGYIGQWDNRIFEGEVPALTYSVTNPLIGLAAGYIKRAPLAWFCSHRRLADGSDAIYSYSYLFKYRIPLPPGAGSLTLPNNPNIKVLAATVAQNKNDDTQPAQPLYDDFTGREPVELRAPLTMEK